MKCWRVYLICCSIGGGIALAQSDKVEQPTALPGAVSRPAARMSSAAQNSVNKVKEVRSRLNRFQRLLSISADERENELASKSDKERAFLRRELQKYDQMAKEDRETALQGLRVWYYVRELVKHPVETRADALPVIPEAERKLVEVRLRRWDLLPNDLQQEILANERTIRYVLPEIEGLSREEQKQAQRKLPQSLQKIWDEKLQEWHALPTERREYIYAQFKRFSELSAKERSKVLETLSQQEREQAEKSLQVVQEIDKLSPEEQAACLDSLRNFAETPPKSDKLYLYLEQLQRWKEMSLQEKDVIKKVKRALLPGLAAPLPGELNEPPRGQMKAAPSPPGAEPQKASSGEKRLSFGDVPEPVQKTIKAHGGSPDLKGIKKVNLNGRRAYSLVLKQDGKSIVLYIAPDGSLVQD